MTGQRRLVVHVGPHKTASSYVQANLFSARRQLHRAGWLYPRLPAFSSDRAHHDLAHAQAPEAGFERLARLWRRRPGLSVILSSEGFSAWSADRFTQLRAALGAETLEIVHVLRDPVERLASYWAEEIKQGRTESLPERMARELANPMTSRFLNPAPALRQQVSRPGLVLHLVPYEHLASEGLDIYEHIARRILGLADQSAKTGPLNTRLPIEITEFIRFLNMNTASPDAAIRKAFLRMTSIDEQRALADLVAREAAEARRCLCVPHQATFLRHIEKRLNAEFAGNFTMDPGPAAIFRHRLHRFAYYAEAGLWRSGAIRQRAHDILGRIAA